MGEKVEEDRVV